MVPQDQQVGVASAEESAGGPGMISDDLDSAFAIQKFGRALARPWSNLLSTDEPLAFSRGGAPSPHEHIRYENELPQPQDFVEFGFTKTKPCCISVS